ncbi:MAG: PASTA domain-containing protein, partial [Ruminococcus sp.]|nr:PASTA domain-containing protein [Ruminococcus sp.]
EEKMMSVMLKQGYAPEEQYRKNGDQGPWTDVYGMCATMYKCITGVVPEDALDRLHEDTLKKPSQLGINIDKSFEVTLMYGLAVNKNNRCKDMTELLELTDRAIINKEVEEKLIGTSQPDLYKTQAADADDFRTQAADGDTFKTQMADGMYDEGLKGYVYSDEYDNMNLNPKTPSAEPKKNKASINAIAVAVVAICAVIVISCLGYAISNIINDSGERQPINTGNDVFDNADDSDDDAPISLTNYKGWKSADAIEDLNSNDIEYSVEYEFSSVVAKDIVISHTPSAGETIYKGDEVVLTISKGEDKCPYEYSQKVVVSAPSGSSNATLKLCNWDDGEWVDAFKCSAKVGKDGISNTYGEGIATTPKGEFKLGVIITTDSQLSNIDNSLWPVQPADKNTCIVDDSYSPYYNMIKDIRELPSGTSYDPTGKHLTNGDCSAMMFIEHNGDGYSSDNVIAGSGSAITICAMNYSISATYGCIDISSSDFFTLVSKLDYTKNTHIETYVE